MPKQDPLIRGPVIRLIDPSTALPPFSRIRELNTRRQAELFSKPNLKYFCIFLSLLNSQLSNSVDLKKYFFLSFLQTMKKCAADSQRLESC